MNWNDDRVVLLQAFRGENFGDGTATKSFQYIHDLVDGLKLMNSDARSPLIWGIHRNLLLSSLHICPWTY